MLWTRSICRIWRLCVTTLALTTVASALCGAANAKEIHLVAFGDSLTAGYNLPPGADFASRLQTALEKAGYRVRVTNAGVSGDTTSGGVARFDWAVPEDTDAAILELGANDALRGISPAIVRQNLETLIGKLKTRNIQVLLAGMRAPANWGTEYVKQFDAIYPELAASHDVLLYPFFLAGVIERPELKLNDALHPNEQGVAEIVRRILPDVRKLLDRVQSESRSVQKSNK